MHINELSIVHLQTSAYGHFNDMNKDLVGIRLCNVLHMICCGAVSGSSHIISNYITFWLST